MFNRCFVWTLIAVFGVICVSLGVKAQEIPPGPRPFSGQWYRIDQSVSIPTGKAEIVTVVCPGKEAVSCACGANQLFELSSVRPLVGAANPSKARGCICMYVNNHVGASGRLTGYAYCA